VEDLAGFVLVGVIGAGASGAGAAMRSQKINLSPFFLGSQFTSKAFTDVLLGHGITISMDGRGRVFDNIFVERLWRNVKYEDVYLKGYESMVDLGKGLGEYFVFYNGERPHQALGQETPDVVHQTAIGGGAMIVDRYPRADEQTPVPLRSTGVCSSAVVMPEVYFEQRPSGATGVPCVA